MLTLLCRDLKTVGPVRETRGRRLNCRPGPSSWDVQPHVPLQSIAGKHAEACHGAIEIAKRRAHSARRSASHLRAALTGCRSEPGRSPRPQERQIASSLNSLDAWQLSTTST